MTDPTDIASTYPQALMPPGATQPVPRRIRARVGETTVLDTTRARYLWRGAFYPVYLIPVEDVLPEQRDHGRSVRDIPGYLRFDWAAMDAWYEEDEQVFVHARNPYIRVDALRSSRRVRVERDGIILAESDAPVLVFETGLPTRHYVERTAMHWEHLAASETESACPYKGQTSEYWDLVHGGTRISDLAWSYRFPTPALAPIAGLVAFYDELVDTLVDGALLPRPITHHRRAS